MARLLCFICANALLVTATGSACGQDKQAENKERATALRRQIAEAERLLRQLQDELAKVDDEFEEPKATDTLIYASNIKVGLVGQLGDSVDRGRRVGNTTISDPQHFAAVPMIREVIDENTVLIGAGRGATAIKVILDDYPSKGLADGKLIEPAPTIRITGTRKHGGTTYYTAKVYVPKKK